MNQQGMVVTFINFIGLVIGVPPIVSGLFLNAAKESAVPGILFGAIILLLLFAANVYFYFTKGQGNVKKHFAKYRFLYGFFLGITAAILVSFSAALSGRSPFVGGRMQDVLPLKEWEFLVILMATALGFYCLGTYHQGKRAMKVISALTNIYKARSSREE